MGPLIARDMTPRATLQSTEDEWVTEILVQAGKVVSTVPSILSF
jgi:hypothetical protein